MTFKLSEKYLNNRKLETLVENQSTFSASCAELHVFETHQNAEKVILQFDNPVLASMLQGKKVMHLENLSSFDFLPGESLMLPANEMMCIDFPEANMDDPTKCLALAISEEQINKTVQQLNETMEKADGEWKFTDYNFHFTNDVAIQQLLNRLLFIFTEGHSSKDVFADFIIRELIIRTLQSENKKIYTENSLSLSANSRMAYIIDYIRNNLDKDLTVEHLAKKAYMSESNFHRVFKNELNMSPVDFINNEKIKLAMSMLKNPKVKIKEVYTACGFNSLSYFIRTFKKKQNMSPKMYQNSIILKN